MKQVIADTNAFLRWLLGDILKQKSAFENILQQAKDKKINLLVPQIIIFEIDFILKDYYQVPKEEIIEKLQTLVSVNYIDIEDREVFITALAYYKKENISLVDLFLLAKSRIEKTELFTFDKKLKKLTY